MTDKDEDRQLVRRIMEENSQNACTRLVNKYHEPLFQFMLDRLRMEAETEDLLQEVFTKVFNNLSSFAYENTMEFISVFKRSGAGERGKIPEMKDF